MGVTKMHEINTNRAAFIAATGAAGGVIAELFGGWNSDITTLVIFMIVDYITGLIVAAVFNKSQKTDSGALSSKVGFVGLCKKGVMMLVVLVAHRLDLLVGTDYIRTAAVIGFCCSELVSIVENAGLMGVPLPGVIIKAIDILKNKNDKE
jgi:toxin secretion/phage lysis holin